jgi:hypothetical protein
MDGTDTYGHRAVSCSNVFVECSKWDDDKQEVLVMNKKKKKGRKGCK